MLKQHGFAGVQGGDVALCRKLGLGVTGDGRVNRPEEAEPFAKRCAEAGSTPPPCMSAGATRARARPTR